MKSSLKQLYIYRSKPFRYRYRLTSACVNNDGETARGREICTAGRAFAEGLAGQHLKERASFHGDLPSDGGGEQPRPVRLGAPAVRGQRSLGPRTESSPVLRRHATVHGGAAARLQPRPQHQKPAQHQVVPTAGDSLPRPLRAQERHGNSRGPACVDDAPLVRRGSRRLPEVPVAVGGAGRVRVLPRGHRVSVGQAEESEEEGHQLGYYRRTVH